MPVAEKDSGSCSVHSLESIVKGHGPWDGDTSVSAKLSGPGASAKRCQIRARSPFGRGVRGSVSEAYEGPGVGDLGSHTSRE